MPRSYEDFVKQTDASIKEKSKAIVTKSEEKAAKSEIDFSRSYEDKELSNCNVELHQSCESVMKNFKSRQNACDEERDSQALKHANSMLSGADFSAPLPSWN